MQIVLFSDISDGGIGRVGDGISLNLYHLQSIFLIFELCNVYELK